MFLLLGYDFTLHTR